jgi:hypothetical protein
MELKIVAILIPLALLALIPAPEPYVDIEKAPSCCLDFGGDAWLCCLEWLGEQPMESPLPKLETVKGDYRDE